MQVKCEIDNFYFLKINLYLHFKHLYRFIFELDVIIAVQIEYLNKIYII